MSTFQGGFRRLGRPRKEGLEEKITEAARQLIERDEKVTVNAIVKESGVSRAAVYRRWPSLTNLVADALDDCLRSEITIDLSGTVKDGFINAFFNYSDLLPAGTYPEKRFRKRMVLTISDSKLQEVYWNFHAKKRRQYPLQALQIAKDRNEIRADVDIEAALDALYGTFYYQFFSRGKNFQDQEATDRALVAFELLWKGMEP